MTTAKKASVRMYRQGLGDCFLLTFYGEEGNKRILIDCGVVLGSPDGDKRTREIVEQLTKDCDGRLDVVVATHEHWDHVSGFKTAADLFDKINIGEIWLAWTEDPNDKQAKRLRTQRAKRAKKLSAAVTEWRAAATNETRADARTRDRALQALKVTDSLLDFFGEGALAAKGDRTREALDYLQKHKAPKKYLQPGDRETIRGANGVTAYVLGPPRDEEMIKRERPSKRTPETYLHEQASAAAAFLSVFREDGSRGRDSDAERYDPFDRLYRIEEADAPAYHDGFFAKHYGFGPGAATDAPSAAPAWRRINNDWLAASTELAIQLDADTNNSSLVLAFELGHDGDVLLFAADAQVGNWLSWQDVTFERSKVTADDLLERTVFYKVGHHASHNATLREHGLEKMSSRSLTAFIPVVAKTAHKIGWGEMPYDPLLERLREKCRSRIVRMDIGIDPEAGRTFHDSVKAIGDDAFEIEFG